MNKIFIAFAVAALAACDNSNQAELTGPDDANTAEANTAAIVLPPSIASSMTYRCSGDNSVLYIDWYSDGSARVKSTQTDVGTPVPAPVEGTESPLRGSAETPSITYAGKTCNT